MHKRSAGILPYRNSSGQLEVLLVHPGGPFWAKKDLGAWSIAKGEYEESEDAFQAALREFQEETGHNPDGPFLQLAQRKHPRGPAYVPIPLGRYADRRGPGGAAAVCRPVPAGDRFARRGIDRFPEAETGVQYIQHGVAERIRENPRFSGSRSCRVVQLSGGITPNPTGAARVS